MEYWTIWNKATVLGYIITASFLAHLTSEISPWLILGYLLYLAVNITIPIFKKTKPKQMLVGLSAVLVVTSGICLEPLFLLLLPIHVYELSSWSGTRTIYAFLIMLILLFLIPLELIPLYLLSGLLSYLLFAGVHELGDKLRRMEEEREKMRADLQRLTRSLSENNEYIRQSAYTIKLEERNRLSQQIHDDVGHAMAGALIQMEASRRLLAINQDKASELLGNAIAIAREGLERIRLTLKDVKPRPEEMGINRLRLFVDELSAKETVTATLTFDGDIDVISPLQWKIIQQNATEAVTNSLKYAKATAINIEVQVLNKLIKAVVSDNGIGVDKVVKGLGILGMEERAASVGGTVIVDGNKGFRVTTLLPYGNL
ncbi:histidine kinase [Brevibacillus ruminantium]|uniref:histidine kinase n=1 Tax=Brevibacillus ruminantium TaxID=2950604 RepID=A0ABY4WHI6_9BACL|nr:histidine kinase [Brevibacillus ruminantium]USG66600.1 histidine kinase [Brevibacillus ruminantium]